MKKIIALIVAVLFVFAVASISLAAEEKKMEPAKKEAAPAKAKAEKKVAAKVMQVTGEVAAVDAAAKTITVKGKKGDVVIAVDDKTLADVKAGDKVTAKYTTADGKNTAKSVIKKTAAAKKAAPAKKAPAAGY
ncbi:MAG: hypothetical protein COW90_09805 [Nitrospirae bacterium CG22_combo_CG10-13_8_21_14_all_44_11]|nr:hypothetical protein [Nitrospirota bacterium]PIP69594.1 MAG: hypothetical protein COW90_09805 [Nitrospirae bacterium CG22_combo_CG10-13_8_21_14_all_44_11]